VKIEKNDKPGDNSQEKPDNPEQPGKIPGYNDGNNSSNKPSDVVKPGNANKPNNLEKTNNKEDVNTGDNTNTAILSGMLLIGGATTCIIKKKKSTNH